MKRGVKKVEKKAHFYEPLERKTRLELATHGVTGRYSNQLNYRTIVSAKYSLFSKGLQRYNSFGFVLHTVDNFFSSSSDIGEKGLLSYKLRQCVMCNVLIISNMTI